MSLKITSHTSSQIAAAQQHIQLSNTRIQEFGKNDSISNKKEPGCLKATWNWITNAFSSVWEWIKMLFCCGCTSRKVQKIINSPTYQAKAFARDPLNQIENLFDSLIDDPEQFLECKKESTKDAIKSFVKTLQEEISIKKARELFIGNPVFLDTIIYAAGELYGKDSMNYIDLLSNVQMLGHKHKVTREVKSKYKKLEKLQNFGYEILLNVISSSCKSVSKCLKKAKATNSEGREILGIVKELLNNFIPDLLKTSQKDLLKIAKDINSNQGNPLKIQELVESFFSSQQLEFIKRAASKDLTALFENPEALGIKNFDLTRQDLHSIFIKALKPKLSKEVIPKLIKFIGDDHPLATMLLNKAQKLLSKSQKEIEAFKDVVLELKGFN